MTKEELKQSLNIPNTTFAMKADAKKNESLMQQWWIQHDIYNKALIKNQHHEQKILHDGPPYANGKLHIGHALNKTLKDIIVRHWTLQGYYSPFVMGWDVHGLPIEHALIKKNINTDPRLSIIEKRNNCLNFAIENVKMQKDQFQRLGIFTDYNLYYKTSDSYIEFNELKLFSKMVQQNLVYKALKPVYWSWSSQSALAEDEIEYHDDESDSIYVTFDLVDGIYKNAKLVIWTTTPWTIPANLAVAVNEKFTYVVFSHEDQKYIVAKSRLDALCKLLNWIDIKIETEVLGKELENMHYVHPLYNDEQMPIILADYVLDSDGTGLVHNAPAFGLDDYKACLKYGIGPEFCPINNYGKFDETVKSKDLVDMFYKDANPMIIDWLKQNNHLLYATKFTHSVAFDWRTKKPVIYRATAQWFIDLDKIREKLINTVQDPNLQFDSNWARKNLAYMVGHRSEWCISRQRYWGVPIIIIYNENNEPILDSELIDYIIRLIEEAKTCNIWFEKPVEYFLTSKYLTDGHKYHKETDIMDVWFDSGSSHEMFKHFQWNYPVQLYLEGSDQFRGWFNSSTITGVIQHEKAPYKTLISHGFVLDEKGNKMSKSLGNTVDPENVANTFGIDVFRLWVASSNWSEDVRIGDNILKQVAENYRRIRNTLFRYSLSNLYDFNPTQDSQIKLEIEDLYILKQLQNNIALINQYYDEYKFIEIVKNTINFTVFLSNWYFDLIKDALYCDDKNALRRKQIQTVLYEILKAYMVLLAPILSHTMEELYQNAKNLFHWKQESVFLLDNIKTSDLDQYDLNKVNEKIFNDFFVLKDKVYSALEELRNNKIINKNNQALVYLTASELTQTIDLNKLKQWLNVADVLVADQFSVKKAEKYHECARCWNYFKDHLSDEQLCNRCNNIFHKE